MLQTAGHRKSREPDDYRREKASHHRERGRLEDQGQRSSQRLYPVYRGRQDGEARSECVCVRARECGPVCELHHPQKGGWRRIAHFKKPSLGLFWFSLLTEVVYTFCELLQLKIFL